MLYIRQQAVHTSFLCCRFFSDSLSNNADTSEANAAAIAAASGKRRRQKPNVYEAEPAPPPVVAHRLAQQQRQGQQPAARPPPPVWPEPPRVSRGAPRSADPPQTDAAAAAAAVTSQQAASPLPLPPPQPRQPVGQQAPQQQPQPTRIAGTDRCRVMSDGSLWWELPKRCRHGAEMPVTARRHWKLSSLGTAATLSLPDGTRHECTIKPRANGCCSMRGWEPVAIAMRLQPGDVVRLMAPPQRRQQGRLQVQISVVSSSRRPAAAAAAASGRGHGTAALQQASTATTAHQLLSEVRCSDIGNLSNA